MAERPRGVVAAGDPVRLGARPAGPPVRTGWDGVEEGRPTTDLDDLGDVDAPPAAVGVLTRDQPGGVARFEPLPDPPPRPRRHTQTAAAARWQIVHNLGWRPHFDVHDSNGRPHLPENVEHPVPGVVSEIVFGMPMVGTADPS